MKTRLVIALLLVATLFAAEPTAGPTGTGSLILVDPHLYTTTYRRISVGSWFQMDNGSAGQTVTVDDGAFAPAACTVTVSREPVVTKRADGQWDITFPAKPPEVRWNDYRLAVAKWFKGEPYPPHEFVVGSDGARRLRSPDAWGLDIEKTIEVGLRSDGTLVWREIK